MELLQENAGWYLLMGGTNLGEGVSCFIVLLMNMMKFKALEVVFESAHSIAVVSHGWVLSITTLHHLLHHQMQVSMT